MFLKLLAKVIDFIREEQGATAVEYAIMLVLIIAVVIVMVGVLGNKTANSFNEFNLKFNPGS